MMTLKCSVEPKAEFMAQYSNFREKTEPVWLKGRYAPKGKGAVFGIVQRRNSLKLRNLKVAYYYALWDLSYGIASRDFVCHKSPPHSRNRLTLWGLTAPNPPKKRMKEGMLYMKDIRIAVRVTAKEKEKIQSKARKCGLSTTEYVKQRALGYEPKGIPPDALFLCLEKLGKLADKANSPELDVEISTVLKEITAAFLLPGKG